jgi:hypothetical protein
MLVVISKKRVPSKLLPSFALLDFVSRFVAFATSPDFHKATVNPRDNSEDSTADTDWFFSQCWLANVSISTLLLKFPWITFDSAYFESSSTEYLMHWSRQLVMTYSRAGPISSLDEASSTHREFLTF